MFEQQLVLGERVLGLGLSLGTGNTLLVGVLGRLLPGLAQEGERGRVHLETLTEGGWSIGEDVTYVRLTVTAHATLHCFFILQ